MELQEPRPVHHAIQQANNTATNAKTQADKGLNFAVNGASPVDNVQLGETVNFADGTNTTATYDFCDQYLQIQPERLPCP